MVKKLKFAAENKELISPNGETFDDQAALELMARVSVCEALPFRGNNKRTGMPNKKRGPPQGRNNPLMDPLVLRRLCRKLSEGFTLPAALAKSGVLEKHYYSLSRTFRRSNDPKLSQLLGMIHGARRLGRAAVQGVVLQHAKTDPGTARWLLARLDPKAFGQKADVRPVPQPSRTHDATFQMLNTFSAEAIRMAKTIEEKESLRAEMMRQLTEFRRIDNDQTMSIEEVNAMNEIERKKHKGG